MTGIYQWLRPRQHANKAAADRSEEVLNEKVEETRKVASRIIKQSRREINKSEEVIMVAEEALRTIKGVKT